MNKFTLVLLTSLLVAGACGPAGGVPPSGSSAPTTTNVPGSNASLPNRLIDGPVPGCVDAFELVNQRLLLPPMTLTFDAGGIIDRIGINATGVSYTFSMRPVNPLDCTSTSLPFSPPLTILFDFTYLGDFSRTDPFCMNGSRLTLTGFTVTGTPLDSLISIAAHGVIWVEIDRVVVERMDALLGNGTFPANGDPRCSSWAEF